MRHYSIWPTDVTIIEIEIEVACLTENQIESKRNFRAYCQTICPLKHWIAYRRRRRASTDRPHTAARAVVGI